MKPVLFTLLFLLVAIPAAAADTEEGFTTIFDGKTFDGWKTSIDNTNTWKIEDGAFVTRGQTAMMDFCSFGQDRQGHHW